MKRLILLLTLLLSFSAFALAQEPAKVAAQPKVLTSDQVQRLVLAEKDFNLAQSELRAAKLVLEKLTAEFALELGLDIRVYDPKIEVINPQIGQIGFLPKPAPPDKTEAKKTDVSKAEKQEK